MMKHTHAHKERGNCIMVTESRTMTRPARQRAVPPAGACAAAAAGAERQSMGEGRGSCTVSAPHSHECSAAGFFSGLAKKGGRGNKNKRLMETTPTATHRRKDTGERLSSTPRSDAERALLETLHAPHCVEYLHLDSIHLRNGVIRPS